MNKKCLLCILLILNSLHSYCNQDSLLNELDKILLQQSNITALKIKHIEKLKRTHASSKPEDQLINTILIFNEYKALNFDSAFVYATRINELASSSNDLSKINAAKKYLCITLLTSGMFKETLDVINEVNVRALTAAEKTEHFIIKARCYYDLADYVKNSHYGSKYNAFGNLFADSAIFYAQKNSYNYHFIFGLKSLRTAKVDQALKAYQKLLNRPNLSLHDYAVVASTLSYLYTFQDSGDKSLNLLIESALADARSSTKETYALFKLSDTLYKAGDTQRAYRYIKAAMQDAQYYGARHRQFEVGTLFRIIEGRQLEIVQKQKNQIVLYALTVTLLSLVIVAFILTVIRQNKKLKSAQHLLSDANESLLNTNQMLLATNNALREANKIKDEYIGYYFNINSDFIDKIDRFKKAVSQKLNSNQYDDIRFIINKIDLKKEREELSQSFDIVFLKLFPNFVEDFNALFEAEHKVRLQDGQLLNTELRIFALIRLGIHDNDRISKILNYSVNTIYAYKTRIKSKAIISNHEFEQKIMEIKAV